MQRFRTMRLYSACLIGFLVVAIWMIAWLRQTPQSTALAAADPPASADVNVPVSTPKPATAPTTAAAQFTVSIDNFAFEPKELSVPVGASVTWINHDDVPHTATSTDQPRTFDSKALDTDDKYSFKFTKRGTYKYFCKVHPHMRATVVVK